MEKFIIIGGVAAGTKTAAKLRRLKPDAKIDLYTEDTHVSYSTCGFPYFIGGNFDNESYLFARTVEEFEKSNIHIHLKHKVNKIDTVNKKIFGENLEYLEIKPLRGEKQSVPKDFFWNKMLVYVGEKGSVSGRNILPSGE